MDRVLEVFLAIKQRPYAYLPEKSICYLRHFLDGYARRMHGSTAGSGFHRLLKIFETWVGEHFDLPVQSQSVFDVVGSYSSGAEHAFDSFFALFDQFSRDRKHISESLTPASPMASIQAVHEMHLREVLQQIRKRPEMWIGYPHFSGVHAYLIGYERAGDDLRLTKTQDQNMYDDFKAWIEKTRFPQGKPRPWFKLIRFYSSHDSGTGRFSAYTVFFDLLDQFSIESGHPGFLDSLP